MLGFVAASVVQNAQDPVLSGPAEKLSRLLLPRPLWRATAFNVDLIASESGFSELLRSATKHAPLGAAPEAELPRHADLSSRAHR
jgi:hypothetical protein